MTGLISDSSSFIDGNKYIHLFNLITSSAVCHPDAADYYLDQELNDNLSIKQR
jgi:hypothetical protein